jgi:hypothetical protein
MRTFDQLYNLRILNLKLNSCINELFETPGLIIPDQYTGVTHENSLHRVFVEKCPKRENLNLNKDSGNVGQRSIYRSSPRSSIN